MELLLELLLDGGIIPRTQRRFVLRLHLSAASVKTPALRRCTAVPLLPQGLAYCGWFTRQAAHPLR